MIGNERTSMFKRVALLTSLFLVSGAAVALACGNPVYLTKNDSAKRVKRAERLLAKGKNKAAKKSLWKRPKTGRRHGPLAFSSSDLGRRAQDLDATADLRMGAGLAKLEDKDRAVKKAISYFRRRADGDLSYDAPFASRLTTQQRPEGEEASPYYRARLAEALSHSSNKTQRDQARLLLEDLHSADLMPDSFAYHRLALLRSEAGEIEGTSEAAERCRSMTRVKKLCKLPAPTKTPGDPEETPKLKKRSKAKSDGHIYICMGGHAAWN
jgi:hypothetical protein